METKKKFRGLAGALALLNVCIIMLLYFLGADYLDRFTAGRIFAQIAGLFLLMFLAAMAIAAYVTPLVSRLEGAGRPGSFLAMGQALSWFIGASYFGAIYIAAVVFKAKICLPSVSAALSYIAVCLIATVLLFRLMVGMAGRPSFQAALAALPFLLFPAFMAFQWLEEGKGVAWIISALALSAVCGLVVLLTLRALWSRRALGPLPILALCALLVLATARIYSVKSQAVHGRPPNEVEVSRGSSLSHDLFIITVDALRPDVVGCYGDNGGLTPAIDRLARDGMRFENAFTASPWTLPAMASMLTGLYPSTHLAGERVRLTRQMRPRSLRALSPRVVMLQEILAHLGYNTAAFLDNVHLTGHYGADRGFYRFFNPYSYSGRDKFLPGEILTVMRKLLGGQQPAGSDAHGDMVIPVFSEWLGQSQDRNVMAWVHLLDPHQPYIIHQELKGVYEGIDLSRAYLGLEILGKSESKCQSTSEEERDLLWDLYRGEVRYADIEVERLIKAIQRAGRYDNAIIIVLSDHGEEFCDHGIFGHGHSLYNVLIRIPLIIKMPGKQGAGTVVSLPVSIVDIFPTVLEIEGIQYQGPIQGRSLANIEDINASPPPCFSEYPHYGKETEAVIRWPLKLIRWPHAGKDRLFDLEADPGETRDLSNERPQSLEELNGILDEHLKECLHLNSLIIRGDKGREVKPGADMQKDLRALGYIR